MFLEGYIPISCICTCRVEVENDVLLLVFVCLNVLINLPHQNQAVSSINVVVLLVFLDPDVLFVNPVEFVNPLLLVFVTIVVIFVNPVPLAVFVFVLFVAKEVFLEVFVFLEVLFVNPVEFVNPVFVDTIAQVFICIVPPVVVFVLTISVICICICIICKTCIK